MMEIKTLFWFTVVCSLCAGCQAFRVRGRPRYAVKVSEKLPSEESPQYLPLTVDDMERFAFILSNISNHIDIRPEVAISIASQEMGWLYSRNITG